MVVVSQYFRPHESDRLNLLILLYYQDILQQFLRQQKLDVFDEMSGHFEASVLM